jgi:DNA-binding response OmpR family regulator
MSMAASTLRPLILICDDELPLRELIKAALGDRYRYVEAADADEAEAALSGESPGAIVLDVMLPGRSGIEFLAELRAGDEEPPIPVVVVSAWQSADDAKAAFVAGADAFVGKPFDPEDLANVVEGLIAA